MADQIWRLETAPGPLVATAIHDGHDLRAELREYIALDELARLREEDPFTARWSQVAPTRVVGLRSRFEVDLNRPREKAVYQKPEDAWGLSVWRTPLPAELVNRSIAEYDAFYAALGELYQQLTDEHGRFVVLDLHTYNHRRSGPEGPVADPEGNPQVNIGTGTMNRARWSHVIDAFMEALQTFEFPGGKLDVRENVKFYGGHHPQWTHERFPESACVIAVEFKKFFMNEWTGEPGVASVEAIYDALNSTVPAILDALQES